MTIIDLDDSSGQTWSLFDEATGQVIYLTGTPGDPREIRVHVTRNDPSQPVYSLRPITRSGKELQLSDRARKHFAREFVRFRNLQTHGALVLFAKAHQSRYWRRSRSNRPKLARPPKLWCTGILRRLMRPKAFTRYVEPCIADMHEEYFAALARNDESGARWAVIRGNLYATPAWLWALLAQVVARVVESMRT